MRFIPIILTVALFTSATQAQELGKHPDFNPNPIPSAPLPSNYETILDNPDVLVMHVHYGAHETVPMHDHPAVATMYVYLNESGPVDIIHEGLDVATVHRPPTHAGAFRIAPGIAERHSVVSKSDTDSEFLRIEFKSITFPDLPEAGKRFDVPAATALGATTEFQTDSIKVARIICPADKACELPKPKFRSLLIPITLTAVSRSGVEGPDFAPGAVHALPPSEDAPYSLHPGSQALLISFVKPVAATDNSCGCKF